MPAPLYKKRGIMEKGLQHIGKYANIRK